MKATFALMSMVATALALLPDPEHTNKQCGLINGRKISCDKGYVCIADPYDTSYGVVRKQRAICVETKTCGGFANLPCLREGQVCNDDPRDSCKLGHDADCSGLCVWPLRET